MNDKAGTKKGETTGQAPSDGKSQPQQSQSPAANQGAQKPDSSAPKQNQGSTQQSGACSLSQSGTQISAQQQTQIQQSVLSARNTPRVDRVNFEVRTGVVVPRSLR